MIEINKTQPARIAQNQNLEKQVKMIQQEPKGAGIADTKQPIPAAAVKKISTSNFLEKISTMKFTAEQNITRFIDRALHRQKADLIISRTTLNYSNKGGNIGSFLGGLIITFFFTPFLSGIGTILGNVIAKEPRGDAWKSAMWGTIGAIPASLITLAIATPIAVVQALSTYGIGLVSILGLSLGIGLSIPVLALVCLISGGSCGIGTLIYNAIKSS